MGAQICPGPLINMPSTKMHMFLSLRSCSLMLTHLTLSNSHSLHFAHLAFFNNICVVFKRPWVQLQHRRSGLQRCFLCFLTPLLGSTSLHVSL